MKIAQDELANNTHLEIALILFFEIVSQIKNVFKILLADTKLTFGIAFLRVVVQQRCPFFTDSID